MYRNDFEPPNHKKWLLFLGSFYIAFFALLVVLEAVT